MNENKRTQFYQLYFKIEINVIFRLLYVVFWEKLDFGIKIQIFR